MIRTERQRCVVCNKTTFLATVPDLLELITTATVPCIKSLNKRTQAIKYQVTKIDKQVEHLNSILDKLYYYLPYDIYSAISKSYNPPHPPIMSFHEPTPPLRLSELASTNSTVSPPLPQQSNAITLTQTNILQHCHQLHISSNPHAPNYDTSSDWSYPTISSNFRYPSPDQSCICSSDSDQPCLCSSPPLSVHSIT